MKELTVVLEVSDPNDRKTPVLFRVTIQGAADMVAGGVEAMAFNIRDMLNPQTTVDRSEMDRLQSKFDGLDPIDEAADLWQSH